MQSVVIKNKKGRCLEWRDPPLEKKAHRKQHTPGAAILVFQSFSLSAFFRCGLGLQRVLGLYDQGFKRDFVAHGNVRKDLAVELDIGGAEAFNEAVVAEAGGTAGGVEAHNPQGSPIALFFPAVTVGILPGVLDG